MLGSPGVGKTSLVRRYVESIFSEDYHSTLGVKIDRKLVAVAGTTVNMLLWDVHGETEGLDVPDNYLRGAAAGLLVFDATRPETIATTCALRDRLVELSPGAITAFAGNKTDLEHNWEGAVADLAQAGAGSPTQTSAKTGAGVDEVFLSLAQRLLKT
jgi:small GTP-binding protein